MKSIEQESYDLVSRLIESSETEGGTDPLKYLELNSMNVMFLACFGRKFNDIKDPEFVRLSSMIEQSMKYAGIENDLANFLPILSIVDYFAGSQATQKKFIKTQRDPVYRQLVEEALTREGPNVFKSLAENGLDFTEDEKIVLACKHVPHSTHVYHFTKPYHFFFLVHS